MDPTMDEMDEMGRDEMRQGDEAPPGETSAQENLCPRCGGSGNTDDGRCPECDGTGVIEEAIGGG